MSTPYEVLGVSPEASEVVVEAAYKALVKEHHPDAGGDAEEFKRIKEAYEKIQEDDAQDYTRGSTASFDGFVDGLLGLGTPVSSESIEGTLDDELILEQGPIRLSLLSLFRTDISDLVWDHEEENVETSDRFLCLFRVENVSEYVQPWDGSKNTVFTGTDGQTYSASNPMVLADDAHSPLPSQYSVNFQDLEPGTWTLGVLAVEPVPAGVDIDRVVYNHSVFEGHQTDGFVKERLRFEFTLTDETRKHMFSLMAQELMQEVPGDSPLARLTSGEEDNSEQAGATSTGRSVAATPEGPSQSTAEDLSPEMRSRIADIVELQPTSNGELADVWGLASGREAYRYLSSNLDEFYYRDDESRIRATRRAEDLER